MCARSRMRRRTKCCTCGPGSATTRARAICIAPRSGSAIEHGGVFPSTLDAVMELPGIGRSTAGAILAFSAGERHPILDGNVKRVLARYYAIDGAPDEAATLAKFWKLADENTPANGVATYTQAIMDLGATVCTRAKPRCEECPIADDCRARIEGRTSASCPRRSAQRSACAPHGATACGDAGGARAPEPCCSCSGRRAGSGAACGACRSSRITAPRPTMPCASSRARVSRRRRCPTSNTASRISTS